MIQVSEDNCKTWKKVGYVTEQDENIFYPHIAVDEKNKIVYVSYENAVSHYINKYTYDELGL